MKWFLLGVAAACLVGGAVISAVLGLLPNRADVVFLALAGTAVVCALLFSLIVSVWDRTNGNDTGLIVSFIGLLVFLGAIVVCPVLALIFGKPLVCYGIGAGAMVLYTAWGSHTMIR